LETNDGRRTILCSKIVLNPKDKPAIYHPKNGQKVSREEFDEIERKKAMELHEMRNSGRRIQIGG
jgi:GLPGLI family protein